MSQKWRELTVALCQTHHLLGGVPAYGARFDEVLKYHEPGLAAVRDVSGSYHIDTRGKAAYAERYARTFGFYEGRAAVQGVDGWYHIISDGKPLYPNRYAWCGNFQEGRCPVRHHDGSYSHIASDGEPAYNERFHYAGDYRDGYAVVQRQDGLHTHLDRNGNPCHGRWFQDLDVFHKGYARACDHTGWFHIDLRGEAAYKRRFQMVEPFYNGQARVEDFDGALMVIDEVGETTLTLREEGRVTPLEKLSADLVGFWRTQTILASVELGVFDALPGDPRELAHKLKLASSSILRLARALRELGLVCPDQEGIWHTTDRGSLLARTHATSMADAASLWGQEHYLAWLDLKDALDSGEPTFSSRFRHPFFEWVADRPGAGAAYQRALATYAKHDYRRLADMVDFSEHNTVIDAGGGHGELLFDLLRRNDQLHGILLDRNEVVTAVDPPSNLVRRCQVVAGDLFSTWEVNADAIVLARVLHDWPDDRALVILKQARDSLMEHGRLYLIEMILDEDTGSGGMLDLNQLVITGGKERTGREYQELLKAAGFRLIACRQLRPVSSVLISCPG